MRWKGILNDGQLLYYVFRFIAAAFPFPPLRFMFAIAVFQKLEVLTINLAILQLFGPEDSSLKNSETVSLHIKLTKFALFEVSRHSCMIGHTLWVSLRFKKAVPAGPGYHGRIWLPKF